MWVPFASAGMLSVGRRVCHICVAEQHSFGHLTRSNGPPDNMSSMVAPYTPTTVVGT